MAIHAGQLFDGKSDGLLSQQVIVIQGGRIAEVGPAGSVKIPASAEEIDLGTGTVLPGLIEGHNHMFKIGDYPGTGAEAAVPLVIQPGTPFSLPFVTLLAAKNAKLDLEFGLYHGARFVERRDGRCGPSHCNQRRHRPGAADGRRDGGYAGIDRRAPLLPPRGLAMGRTQTSAGTAQERS